MIEGNPQPLIIAARVLQPDTIDAMRCLSDYSERGWRILDRWALNSPDELRRLEAEGEVVLLGRLLEQQRLEQRAIDRQPVGMPEMEALAIAKVQTELRSVAEMLADKAKRREALMLAVSNASPADLEPSAERIREGLRKSLTGKRQPWRLVRD